MARRRAVGYGLLAICLAWSSIIHLPHSPCIYSTILDLPLFLLFVERANCGLSLIYSTPPSGTVRLPSFAIEAAIGTQLILSIMQTTESLDWSPVKLVLFPSSSLFLLLFVFFFFKFYSSPIRSLQFLLSTLCFNRGRIDSYRYSSERVRR